jgi:diguanylate cyclase (GGDEF)-like protein
VESNKLAWVLSDFARTMLTDFPIEGILDHLVLRIVEILPITAAGVTLIVDGAPPRYIAASDDDALRFEQLQSDLGEGPCLLASQSGRGVTVPDMASESRFPLFAPAALAAGLAAVFAFPLRHGQGRLGALDLYRDSPGRLNEEDLEAAQTLADVAAAYLINAESRQEAQQTTDKLIRIAHLDALTGLPNRQLLQQRLDHAAERARRSHTAAAVLFADLDHFKQINDAYGHSVGDDLLIAVASRLSHLLRPGDTLSRVSGDEFVFLCEDLEDPHNAESLAARITDAFHQPFLVGDLQLSITASVGVAYSGPGVTVSQQMVVDADTAMYEAKRAGGAGHRINDQQQAHRGDQRHSLERDLRTALRHDTLQINYQPIVRTLDGLVTGVEALLRWTDDHRGPVPALVAIGTAERSGLINDVGRWVLQHSAHDLAQWTSQAPATPLTMSVNVSGRQLLSHGFTNVVAGVLATTDMDPATLILEVTENILIEDDDRAITILADLKSMGVQLALDDFGTGFSSLSYLRRLPIDVVKIDRAFISDLNTGTGSNAIVEAVTHMAHQLGFTVIAEGVETQSQRDTVAHIGCDSCQGFYYAKAMPADILATQIGTQTMKSLHLPAEDRPLDGSSPRVPVEQPRRV